MVGAMVVALRFRQAPRVILPKTFSSSRQGVAEVRNGNRSCRREHGSGIDAYSSCRLFLENDEIGREVPGLFPREEK